MLRPIEFYNQHRFFTQKIRHERPARCLPAKLQSIEPPVAQSRPQFSLLRRLPLSQPACGLDQAVRHFTHTFRQVEAPHLSLHRGAILRIDGTSSPQGRGKSPVASPPRRKGPPFLLPTEGPDEGLNRNRISFHLTHRAQSKPPTCPFIAERYSASTGHPLPKERKVSASFSLGEKVVRRTG